MAVNKTVEQIVFEGIDQISKPSKQAQQTVTDLKKTVDDVKSALAAVGVTVGAGAFVNLHMQTLKATAALDDMSESTGASVENLSAIQRVARVGGQDFEGLTGQISKMIKGLKQGGEEGGKSAAAFEYLGIKTKDAAGRFRDTGEIVIELANKLSKYEDNGNKVALVQDALGKGAERYLPLLKDISEKTDLHATVTKEQAAAAELAEKNINRLKLAMEDARRETVNEFTPAIIKLTDQLLAAQKAAGGFWSGVAGFMSVTNAQAEDPMAALDKIQEKLTKLRADRDVLAGPSIGAKFNRMMAPEDLATLDKQIAHAERQQRVLQEIHVRKVSGNMAGMVEDAAGIHPANAKARLAFQSADTKKHGQTLSPYESAELQARQAIEKAKLGGSSEFTDTRLDIEAGKYGKINAAQKDHLLQLAAERDEQKNVLELQKEADKLTEAQGPKTLQYMEARRKFLDETKLELDAARRPGDDDAAAQARADLVQEEERYRRKRELLAQFVTDQGEHDAIAEAMEQEHQQRLTQISDNEARTRYNVQKVYRQLDLQSAGTFLGYMSGLMNTKSRELFEIGKVAAIGKAVIDTYAAAQGAYAAMASIPFVGPALGVAAAAAAIAAGLANVAAIKAQNYGSGSGATPTFSASPTTGLPEGTPGGGATPNPAGGGQGTVVHLHGDTFDREQVRELLDQIFENSRDGGRVVIG